MFIGELADRFGRVARDLRVSLTDRCNLRCSYCMPAEGLVWLPTEDTLSDQEVLRLIRVAVELLGVTSVRFTGGEPLLRKGLERIVAGASQLSGRAGRPDLALTTNGLGLAHRASALREAGLDRINISLDSVDHRRYAQISRRDRLDDALAGLAAAKRCGLSPIKVNAVVMRDVNEVDVVPLARFCLQQGVQLRFIEHMPLGPDGQWSRAGMVTADEVRALLLEEFVLSPAAVPGHAALSQLWRVAPSAEQPGGELGVIASVSQPFCGSCDRTRLTADGQIRSCLFSAVETDLRGPMRSGASDDELAALWVEGQRLKPRAHGIDSAGFRQPSRTMSAIGG